MNEFKMLFVGFPLIVFSKIESWGGGGGGGVKKGSVKPPL